MTTATASAGSSSWLNGWAAKVRGMAAAEAGTDDWWRSCCDAGIAHLAKLRTPFTAFDLVALGVPEPHHPNAWGPRMLAAARAGIIEVVGVEPSRRPSTAMSLVRTWRGATASPS